MPRQTALLLADETDALTSYLHVNSDALVTALHAVAKASGVKLKSDPAALVADLVAIAGAQTEGARTSVTDVKTHSLGHKSVADDVHVATDNLHAEYTRLRGAVRATFGALAVENVFSKGRAPTQPTKLLGATDVAVKALLELGPSWKPLGGTAISLDPAAAADSLEALASTLRAACEARSAQEGGTAGELGDRDSKVLGLKDTRTGIRHIAEGLFTLVGDHSRADHVAEHHHAPSKAAATSGTPTAPTSSGTAPAAPAPATPSKT